MATCADGPSREECGALFRSMSAMKRPQEGILPCVCRSNILISAVAAHVDLQQASRHGSCARRDVITWTAAHLAAPPMQLAQASCCRQILGAGPGICCCRKGGDIEASSQSHARVVRHPPQGSEGGVCQSAPRP